MSATRGLSDGVVILSGILTSVATAYALFSIQFATGFALHAFSFWFVIPAGALLAGFLAASGYVIAARLMRYRPTRAILAFAVLVAIGAYFLIYYFQYTSLRVQGRAVSDVLTFGTFLRIVITNMKINLMGVTTTGSIGFLGYAKVALQLAGFILPVFHAYGLTREIPYCETCSLRVWKAAWVRRYTGYPGEIQKAAQTAVVAIASGNPEQAISGFGGFGEDQPSLQHPFRATMTLWKCDQCGAHIVDVAGQQKERVFWKKAKEMSYRAMVGGAAPAGRQA